MAHDATKVLLGATASSNREGISEWSSSPVTYPAGTAVRLKSDGALSKLVGDGQYLGVSLGKGLSDVLKTAVLRAGLGVPVLLSAKPATGSFVITSYANLVSGTDDSITVGATVFTAQAGAVTPGDATFRAATDNATTAASLAAQINAHATAGALVEATVSSATVTLTAKLNTTAGNAIALDYTDNDANVGATKSGVFLTGGADAADYVVKGAKVYFDDITGLADHASSNSTVSDAVYVSGVLTGIDEGGSSVAVALVDMPGGL